jgi:hypothetical protein
MLAKGIEQAMKMVGDDARRCVEIFLLAGKWDFEKINILGSDYTIKRQTKDENQKLENAYGLCESYSKEIVIDTFDEEKKNVMVVDNFEEFEKKVLRHEIVHAFLGESGLKSNSEWAENEEMVDWFAIQAPKIFKVFKDLKII